MNSHSRLSSDFRTLADLDAQLGTTDRAVLLVEGTRQVPVNALPQLISLGEFLARRYPSSAFRTGNASGADEAFASGVARVDASRLEYVIPYATMRQQHAHPSARRMALDAVDVDTLRQLVEVSNQASPQNERITNYYLQKPGKSRAVMQAAYLLRDTLKVLGCLQPPLSPATAAVFYINEADPLGGGTGHTIRVCRAARVPVVIQSDWQPWVKTTR